MKRKLKEREKPRRSSYLAGSQMYRTVSTFAHGINKQLLMQFLSHIMSFILECNALRTRPFERSRIMWLWSSIPEPIYMYNQYNSFCF